jgi:hypothetical protein
MMVWRLGAWAGVPRLDATRHIGERGMPDMGTWGHWDLLLQLR